MFAVRVDKREVGDRLDLTVPVGKKELRFLCCNLENFFDGMTSI